MSPAQLDEAIGSVRRDRGDHIANAVVARVKAQQAVTSYDDFWQLVDEEIGRFYNQSRGRALGSSTRPFTSRSL